LSKPIINAVLVLGILLFIIWIKQVRLTCLRIGPGYAISIGVYSLKIGWKELGLSIDFLDAIHDFTELDIDKKSKVK
jgi:hypothetical protein